jgi:hypothetical protein
MAYPSFLPSTDSFINYQSIVKPKPTYKQPFLGTGSPGQGIQYDMPSVDMNPLSGSALMGNGNANTLYGGSGVDVLGRIKPPVTGEWFDMQGKGGLAIGGANVALGAFNSWMGLKNQKFMQDYYGKDMQLKIADYANNARSANESLGRNFSEGLNARGISASSDVGKQQYADYMSKWGAKETI